MPEPVEIKAMILVKAAPVLTSELQESMCVAAMRLGSQPEWIRLHPVPFRDLADDTKFRKYQEVTVQAIRPRSDRRPESWTPIEGSIQLGETLRTDHGWSTPHRRSRWCELLSARSYSLPSGTVNNWRTGSNVPMPLPLSPHSSTIPKPTSPSSR